VGSNPASPTTLKPPKSPSFQGFFRFRIDYPLSATTCRPPCKFPAPAEAPIEAWAKGWLDWSLSRWMDERAGRHWFKREGDRLLAAFPCPEKLRHDIESMTAELVDYRLAHYAKTRLQAAAELSTGRIEFLPLNRDYSPIIVTPHEAPPRSGDTPIRRSLGGFALPSTISSKYPIKNQQSEFINRQSNRVARGRWPCRETRHLLCRLALRTLHQAVRKIPCPVHDAFDTKGIAFHVKEQMAVERSFHLNAPHVSEFAAPSPGTRQCVGSFHARPTDSVRPRLPPFLDGP